MTYRVVLDAEGLRVSKPGSNVLTTGYSGLQFNSDWAGMGMLMKGFLTTNNGVITTINFGKTFSRPVAGSIYVYDAFSNGWTPMGTGAFKRAALFPEGPWDVLMGTSNIKFYSTGAKDWAYVIWEQPV